MAWQAMFGNGQATAMLRMLTGNSGGTRIHESMPIFANRSLARRTDLSLTLVAFAIVFSDRQNLSSFNDR